MLREAAYYARMAWYYAGAASLEDAGFVTRREDEEAAG